MANAQQHLNGKVYQNIVNDGLARVHLGDVHYHEPHIDGQIKSSICEGLSFLHMERRRDDIAEAEDGTWASNDTYGARSSDRTALPRQLLFSWLGEDNSSDQKLFWIFGKPASGKSVFMKDLRNANRTLLTLRNWAGDATLVILEHYFWVAGGSLQSSWLGMLRNLLHQCLLALSAADHMILLKRVFGERWMMGRHTSWSTAELTNVLRQILSNSTLRVAIFLDGLDECMPQENLEKHMEYLSSICAWPNTKLCVSSRPWPAFSRSRQASHRIYLEELSHRDMWKFVAVSLTRAEASQSNCSDFRDRSEPATRLIDQIVDQAEGVFLWTKLVVRALRSELRKRRNFASLQRVLAIFPADLEHYYRDLIWDRVPGIKVNLTDTACALFIALNLDPEHGRFIPYFLLSQDNLDVEFRLDENWPKWYTPEYARALAEQTSSFLAETCGDILALRSNSGAHRLDGRVQFTHRTMLDFFGSSEMVQFIAENVPSHFHEAQFKNSINFRTASSMFLMHDMRCAEIQRLLNDITLYVRQQSQLTDRMAQFVSDSEDLAILHLENHCTCLGLWHRPGMLPLNSWSLGLYRHGYAALRRWPHLALDMLADFTFLGNDTPFSASYGIPLDAAIMSCPGADFDAIVVPLIRRLLEIGCDPNASYHTVAGAPHTIWGTFLARWRQRTRDGKPFQHSRAMAAVATLLIEHGASTWLSTCITEHAYPLDLESPNASACRWVTFKDVLRECTPAHRQSRILRAAHHFSHSSKLNFTHRKQKLLAFLSFADSSPHCSWDCTPSVQFVHGWINNLHVTVPCDPPPQKELKEAPVTLCKLCRRSMSTTAVFICLDCAGFPIMCIDCACARTSAHCGHYALRSSPAVFEVRNMLAHIHQLLDVIREWLSKCVERDGVAVISPRTSLEDRHLKSYNEVHLSEKSRWKGYSGRYYNSCDSNCCSFVVLDPEMQEGEEGSLKKSVHSAQKPFPNVFMAHPFQPTYYLDNI